MAGSYIDFKFSSGSCIQPDADFVIECTRYRDILPLASDCRFGLDGSRCSCPRVHEQ